eukprot:EST46858.1 Cysteine-rich membrane protein 2 [Spironucleus salmonicida]
MTESGVCSNMAATCNAQYYCPAQDQTIVDCQPCSEGVSYGSGCYCKDHVQSYNCSECRDQKCVKCIPETYLEAGECEDCPHGCETCTDGSTCTKCIQGYVFHPDSKSCAFPCTSSSDCLDITGGFCDQKSKTCKHCAEECLDCTSETTCNVCGYNYVMTTLGTCTPECKGLQTGFYCLDGQPHPCSDDSTSECNCGRSAGCATCSSDGKSCQVCLLHIQKDSAGNCTQCEHGFAMNEGLCWAEISEDPGTCSFEETTCAKGHYCPEFASVPVACLPCTEDMGLGHGCFCEVGVSLGDCWSCAGTQCAKCLSGTFLVEGACADCAEGCKKCEREGKCDECWEDYKLDPETQQCVFKCRSNLDCFDRDEGFCDMESEKCLACVGTCEACTSLDFCNACSAVFVTTTNGTCEPSCSNLHNGQFCDNGESKMCFQDLTSECKCGSAKNCASCEPSGNTCSTCLPHTAKDSSGACTECEPGYHIVGTMCWPQQQDISVSGTCSYTELECKTGYYCPVEYGDVVACLPCSEGIDFSDGCFCEDSVQTFSCLSCFAGQCSKCMQESFLIDGQCHYCSNGCLTCTDEDTCVACLENYVMDEVSGQCTFPCTAHNQCHEILDGFCDPVSQSCQPCAENCNFCSNFESCSNCRIGFVTTTAGECTEECFRIKDGYYCNNGVPSLCNGIITSQCKCADAMNCGSCTEDFKDCAECLPHMLKDRNGKCKLCAEGYQKQQYMCWADGTQAGEQGNKLSGIQITAIILSVVAIVIVIGSTITLIQKYKRRITRVAKVETYYN